MTSKTFKIIPAVLALATSLAAQDVRLTPADPVADRLVAAALAKSPEIRIANATLEAAQRRIEPARTLPDPSASLTYQNDGRSFSLGEAEGSYLGLMLSQAFPWPGKLGLAAEAAKSEAKEIELATIDRASRTIEARVRNAWVDLVLARAIDQLVDERRATASQIEATARDRYAAGLAIQQDVIRAQIELARVDELKAAQRATIAARIAELNRLTGNPMDADVASPATLPAGQPVPATSEIVSSVASRSPEAAAARQAIETGRVSVGIARKNFLPDFVVSGGSMYRGSFEMGPMWQVGVGISLPVWTERRQKNQLAEAQARLVAREAQSDLVPRELELRTRERIAQLVASNDVAALYREKILPLDELSLESALASYTSGKVPFITVLDAVNTLYSDRAIFYGRLAESAKWRVAIDEASLQPTAMPGAPSMGSSGMGGNAGATQSSQPTGKANNSSSMSSMR